MQCDIWSLILNWHYFYIKWNWFQQPSTSFIQLLHQPSTRALTLQAIQLRAHSTSNSTAPDVCDRPTSRGKSGNMVRHKKMEVTEKRWWVDRKALNPAEGGVPFNKPAHEVSVEPRENKETGGSSMGGSLARPRCTHTHTHTITWSWQGARHCSCVPHCPLKVNHDEPGATRHRLPWHPTPPPNPSPTTSKELIDCFNGEPTVQEKNKKKKEKSHRCGERIVPCWTRTPSHSKDNKTSQSLRETSNNKDYGKRRADSHCFANQSTSKKKKALSWPQPTNHQKKTRGDIVRVIVWKSRGLNPKPQELEESVRNTEDLGNLRNVGHWPSLAPPPPFIPKPAARTRIRTAQPARPHRILRKEEAEEEAAEGGWACSSSNNSMLPWFQRACHVCGWRSLEQSDETRKLFVCAVYESP